MDNILIDRKKWNYVPQLDKKHPYYNALIDPKSS